MMATMDDPRILRGMAVQLGRRRERLDAGERPLGWKVGFGAPAAMQKLAIKAPLIGFLTDKARVATGATVSLAGWSKPAAEPEIAVHVGRDLTAGADRGTARAAIAGLGPAIELADVDRPPEDVERILAANIYQRCVIVGSCDASRAGGAVDGLHGHISRNGSAFAQTSDPQALTGELIDIVRHVADTLAAFGEILRAGQIIITGSIVPPLWVEAGEEILFELDPVGSVSVRFAADDRQRKL
ncbi:MAG TPA: fumarylacetoacetate hydrolase family protein [Burkholderiales bacterium]|nr:fumarylacetoacetate hydrolase family protein [Burkholderiales bacterium]